MRVNITVLASSSMFLASKTILADSKLHVFILFIFDYWDISAQTDIVNSY